MKKISLFLILTICLPVLALVKLPSIFSDHAVLAKSKGTVIFGSADPGESVMLTFAGKSASAVAGKDGRWQIKLDLSDTTAGPHVLKVNHLTFNDILVGEVFLASGQSNMAFLLKRSEGYRTEKSLPVNTYLRTFNVAPDSEKLPVMDLRGRWIIAAPDTVGDFSAVGYFFAKKMQNSLKVPVAVINSSVGGTEIECWISREALSKFPQAVKEGKKRDYLYESYPQRHREFLEQNRAWEKKYQRIDDQPLLPPTDGAWKKAVPPVAFGNGIYFLRTTIDIPEALAANGFRINMMRTYSPVQLYIDGKRFGIRKDDSAYQNGYFISTVKRKQLTPGKHEVVLRYFVSHDRVRLPRVVYFGNLSVTEKEWEILCVKNFGKPDAAARKERPRLPGMLPSRNRLWSRLYNGMIYPLTPYTLSGVIWYQGESNAKNAAAYRKLFPALINDWRKQFANEKLPFYFCQLASYTNKSASPEECGDWPALRDAQSAALKLPETGMAVLTDAGEALDIHPIDKKTPGWRLADLALKQIYNWKITASGPMVSEAVKKGKSVLVRFTGCDGGLTARELPAYHHLMRTGGKQEKLVRNSPSAQVEGFALCGKDGKWFWADRAEIEGSCVIVSSEKVPEPVKIRFGWMNNPTVNLYNNDGFPAVPFESVVK